MPLEVELVLLLPVAPVVPVPALEQAAATNADSNESAKRMPYRLICFTQLSTLVIRRAGSAGWDHEAQAGAPRVALS